MITASIQINIPQSLAKIAGEANTAAILKADVDTLLARLGLLVVSNIQLVAVAGEIWPEKLISFSLNGKSLPYPNPFTEQAFMLVVSGRPNEIFFVDNELADALLAFSPEQFGRFMTVLCREVLSLEPGLFFTLETAERYRQELILYNETPPSAQQLQAILIPVLNLRLSLANYAAVAEALPKTAEGESWQSDISEALIQELRPKKIALHFHPNYLKALTIGAKLDEVGNFKLMRDGLFYELGVRFPDFVMVADEQLQPDTFSAVINDLPTMPRRGLNSNECLANGSTERLGEFGFPAHPAINPANGNEAAVISIEFNDQISNLGMTTWSQLGYVILEISAWLRQHSNCFIDLETTENAMSGIEPAFPTLVSTVREKISLTLLTQTLRQLLQERITIRGLPQILQAMLTFDYIVANPSEHIIFDERLPVLSTPKTAWLYDAVNYTSHVRTSVMMPYISHKYSGGTLSMVVLLLDHALENKMKNWEAQNLVSVLRDISDGEKATILTAVRTEMEFLPHVSSPPVLLTTTDVRPIIRAIIGREFPNLPIVAYQELDPGCNLEPIGRISLDGEEEIY